ELTGHHRDRIATVDIGEHRDEAVLYRGEQQVDVPPAAQHGEIDRKLEWLHRYTDRSWNSSSFTKTRIASKLSFCHLSAWSYTSTRRAPRRRASWMNWMI